MLDCVFYFNRVKLSDYTKFNLWVKERLRNSPYKSLIIYPEGTRRKKGALHIAFDYDLPVQKIKNMFIV